MQFLFSFTMIRALLKRVSWKWSSSFNSSCEHILSGFQDRSNWDNRGTFFTDIKILGKLVKRIRKEEFSIEMQKRKKQHLSVYNTGQRKEDQKFHARNVFLHLLNSLLCIEVVELVKRKATPPDNTGPSRETRPQWWEPWIQAYPLITQ